MDWIDMAQGGDRLRALVNALMNIPSSIKCEEYLEADDLVASQEGLCSVEFLVSYAFKKYAKYELYVCSQSRHSLPL